MKKNFIMNLIYEMFVVLTPLILTPYLSRVLGPDGIGIKSYTFSLTYYFALFGSLGISIYGQRIISLNKNNEYERSKSFIEISILKFISMAISMFAFCLVFLSLRIEEDYFIYFFPWILYLIDYLLSIRWYYAGIEKFSFVSVVSIIFKIISIALIFVFVNSKEDLLMYLYLFNGVPLVATIFLNVWVLKGIKKVKFNELGIKRHLKSTLVYFLPTIATTIYSTIDKTMIGIITRSNEENGYYEQAEKIIKFALGVFSSSYPIIRSRFTILCNSPDSTNDKDKTEKLFIDICMTLIVPLFIGIFLVTNDFVPLFFGENYDGVVPIMMVLSLLVIFLSLSGLIYSMYIYPYGEQGKVNKFYFIIVIINFVLNLVFIYYFKALGAAISSVISEFVLLVLFVLYARNRIKFSIFAKATIKPLIAALIMGIFVYFSDKYIDNTILFFSLRILLSIIIYFVALIIMRHDFTINTIKRMFLVIKRNVRKEEKTDVLAKEKYDEKTIEEKNENK